MHTTASSLVATAAPRNIFDESAHLSYMAINKNLTLKL